MSLVHFQFLLPSSHPNRIPINKLGHDGTDLECSLGFSPQNWSRTGVMTAFTCFEQFEQYVDEILDLITDCSKNVNVSNKVLEAVENASESKNSVSTSVSLNLGDAVRNEEQNQVFFSVFRLFFQ